MQALTTAWVTKVVQALITAWVTQVIVQALILFRLHKFLTDTHNRYLSLFLSHSTHTHTQGVILCKDQV